MLRMENLELLLLLGLKLPPWQQILPSVLLAPPVSFMKSSPGLLILDFLFQEKVSP